MTTAAARLSSSPRADHSEHVVRPAHLPWMTDHCVARAVLGQTSRPHRRHERERTGHGARGNQARWSAPGEAARLESGSGSSAGTSPISAYTARTAFAAFPADAGARPGAVGVARRACRERQLEKHSSHARDNARRWRDSEFEPMSQHPISPLLRRCVRAHVAASHLPTGAGS
jgi:hypothetical protein